MNSMVDHRIQKSLVIPANAGIQTTSAIDVTIGLGLVKKIAGVISAHSAIGSWIPAFAGMTR
jgi:hypothetical protein